MSEIEQVDDGAGVRDAFDMLETMLEKAKTNFRLDEDPAAED